MEWLVVEEDAARQGILDALERGGQRLAQLPERYRRDPDVVLAALPSCPEALLAASPRLRGSRGFLREAVARSWRALASLPEELRGRGLVLTAAARDPRALQLAPEQVRRDPHLPVDVEAAREARLLAYEGETLRLAGPSGMQRTADSRLRFAALPASGATRHCLRVGLRDGRVAFQVVSCLRGCGFRVVPAACGPEGFSRLAPGDPGAVAAAVASAHGGPGGSFLIEEEPGTVVSVYVELLGGFAAATGTTVGGHWSGAAGTSRGVAVWYVVETGLGSRAAAPLLAQCPCLAAAALLLQPALLPQSMDACEATLIVDADVPQEVKQLCWEAETLDERILQSVEDPVLSLILDIPSFDARAFLMRDQGHDVTGGRRLALLAGAAGKGLLGYCLYADGTRANKGFFWVQHVFVVEAQRSHGLGRVLMHWAVAAAERAGLRGVRLKSTEAAVPFYEALGFRAHCGPAGPGECLPMEFRLWQRA